MSEARCVSVGVGLGALEVVAPLVEGVHKGEELLLVSWVMDLMLI